MFVFKYFSGYFQMGLSDYISFVLGMIVGQEVNLPRVRPMVMQLYARCLEMMNNQPWVNQVDQDEDQDQDQDQEEHPVRRSFAELFDNILK